MDDKSIEKIMEQREKRYIWLERKLRINLAVTTSVVAAFFLIIFLIQNRAFTNVLDNAVKYSPAGSRVEIRVNLYYSYVSVEVEDEGIGVDKSEYTDIFKRFYRGKRTEVETQEGAGVGLYLVRKILEGQGGNVRVQASANGGSVFWMMLPK